MNEILSHALAGLAGFVLATALVESLLRRSKMRLASVVREELSRPKMVRVHERTLVGGGKVTIDVDARTAKRIESGEEILKLDSEELLPRR